MADGAPVLGSHQLPEEGIVVPLHRLGTPAEFARAVVYVVESDFMTGGSSAWTAESPAAISRS